MPSFFFSPSTTKVDLLYNRIGKLGAEALLPGKCTPQYILYTPSIHLIHALNTPYTRPQYTLYTPSIHLIHALNTPYTRPQYTLYTPSIHLMHALNTSYTRPQYILYTPSVHLIHALNTSYTRTPSVRRLHIFLHTIYTHSSVLFHIL